MRFFDLHCDTIGECFNRALSLYSNELHFDLMRAGSLGSVTQVFAIWIPDELRGDDALSYFNRVAGFFERELEKNGDIISSVDDKRATPVKAVLALEGGSGAGGTFEGLEHVCNRGVKIITLTWNAENEVAGGAYSEAGFTDYGKEFVSFCESKDIIIDASHLNRRSFFQLEEISEKPFIASHSNADIVNTSQGRKRNLSLEQIEIIKKRNGLIGINLFREFLEDEEKNGYDALRRQIEFFLEKGCGKIISFGTDFDGCEISPSFKGVEKIPEIYNNLGNYYNKKLLDALFFENAEQFFKYRL